MNTRNRLGALAFASALIVGACGGGGTTPSGSAAGTPAPGGTVPACLSFADIYSLVGPESESFTTWDASQPLAAELGSTTVFPNLPITITAPGEESGTFDSFVELVLADFLEERGQSEDDPTRLSNYQSSANDNAIIDGISGSAGSFGWVGFAFYEESVDKVRAFQVAEEPNGTCVEPTAETIASNEYPIARDLYIYVNKAKAASNPAVAAYVDYYLADGTIERVLETVPYVPLGADAIAESKAAWEAGKPANAAPDGTVFVTGSSTVEPISNGVAEAFKAANPGFNYTVEGPGTGDGFQKFCAGEADIADASRQIRDDENEAGKCAAAGTEFIELKVAIDGIAVLTQQ